jgi:VIT1/CCC1 family predicted Fe2+/Mn2+ transporter
VGIEKHYINRSNWLRAAVLGANDGIISTASLIIGVSAACNTRYPIILAGLAGLVAGALSMAAGEYVSVSSQSDIEEADLEREKKELDSNPSDELNELAEIYEQRGLDKKLAMQVALKLTEHDALAAHARDELGINKHTCANPLQAAFASGGAFLFGAFLPMLVATCAPLNRIIICQYIFTIFFLAITGAIASKAGGANIFKGILRVCFWGTIAMVLSALVGYLFGVKLH